MIFIGANKWLKTLLPTASTRAATAIDNITPSILKNTTKQQVQLDDVFESRLVRKREVADEESTCVMWHE